MTAWQGGGPVRWEYHFEKIESDWTDGQVTSRLNALGQLGWELVQIITSKGALFKRPEVLP
jgi:hypothetical protein